MDDSFVAPSKSHESTSAEVIKHRYIIEILFGQWIVGTHFPSFLCKCCIQWFFSEKLKPRPQTADWQVARHVFLSRAQAGKESSPDTLVACWWKWSVFFGNQRAQRLMHQMSGLEVFVHKRFRLKTFFFSNKWISNKVSQWSEHAKHTFPNLQLFVLLTFKQLPNTCWTRASAESTHMYANDLVQLQMFFLWIKPSLSRWADVKAGKTLLLHRMCCRAVCFVMKNMETWFSLLLDWSTEFWRRACLLICRELHTYQRWGSITWAMQPEVRSLNRSKHLSQGCSAWFSVCMCVLFFSENKETNEADVLARRIWTADSRAYTCSGQNIQFWSHTTKGSFSNHKLAFALVFQVSDTHSTKFGLRANDFCITGQAIGAQRRKTAWICQFTDLVSQLLHGTQVPSVCQAVHWFAKVAPADVRQKLCGCHKHKKANTDKGCSCSGAYLEEDIICNPPELFDFTSVFVSMRRFFLVAEVCSSACHVEPLIWGTTNTGYTSVFEQMKVLCEFWGWRRLLFRSFGYVHKPAPCPQTYVHLRNWNG